MVHPRETRLFTGVVSKQQFPTVSRAILRLMGAHYGDFRNSPDIDAWTTD
jgi:menaquinone-dependent protoporphyrinogen oxidase